MGELDGIWVEKIFYTKHGYEMPKIADWLNSFVAIYRVEITGLGDGRVLVVAEVEKEKTSD